MKISGIHVLILATSVALVGMRSPCRAQSSLDPYFFKSPSSDVLRQQLQQLQNRQSELQNELNLELRRVTLYLTLLDHILTMQRVLATNPPVDHDLRLRSTRQYLYYNSFTAAHWQSLVQDHRTWAESYFSRVEQISSQSQNWPSGRSPAEWRSLARQELMVGRQRYYERMAQGGDPTPELRRASEVLTWSQGFATLTGGNDYFGPAPQRAANLVAQRPQ